MHPKMTKSKRVLKMVGHELKTNPPEILAKTRAKNGDKAAHDQFVAILLSKARKKGLRVAAK